MKQTIQTVEINRSNWEEDAKAVRDLLAKIYPEEIPGAYLHSFGCQQNIADGERLKGYLVACGYGLVDRAEDAKFILFNTCAVREHAEERVFGNLGALKALKEKQANLLIAVCGCMTEQDQVAGKIKSSFPQVDFVFGSGDMASLPSLLRRRLSGSARIFERNLSARNILEDQPVVRENTFRAYLPIMSGCDNFCSYCIVPYVRGRERSREPEEIIKEAKLLISEGYRELLLLGQNVNSYGKGLSTEIDFADLLGQLDEIEGDFWIRFMTSHPKDAGEKLLQRMAKSKHICHALHLPVQSGNDQMLSQMNRKYTSDHYLTLIRRAKELMPDLTLSSDIIVGFPGETQEQFQDTYRLVKEVEYSQLFTFIYSKRSGTKAADLPDPITHQEKTKRLSSLLSLQSEISDRLHHSQIGKVEKVLVDGIGKSKDGFLSGRTQGNYICEFPGSVDQIGSFATVRVEDATNWCLVGKQV